MTKRLHQCNEVVHSGNAAAATPVREVSIGGGQGVCVTSGYLTQQRARQL
jgi:hypothetical protein